MRRALLGLVGVASCTPPSPGLRLVLAEGPAQMCPSTDCADIPMACATWISIRFVDPAQPGAPYLSQCAPVPQNRNKDLCSIAGVDLETTTLPLRDLEVQVALYPESMIAIDPLSGEGTCPSNVSYDAANGFPVESASTPALGGRTFYRPGDEDIVVTLGCTHLEAINDAICVGAATLPVTATIADFDTRVSVDPNLGDRLNVAIGEPRPMGAGYVLNPAQTSELARTTGVSPPAWSTDLDQLFTSTACLVVLDSAPQSTSLLTCVAANVTTDDLDVQGVWLSKASLDQILAALALPQFPSQGLTIGIVLDRNGTPFASQTVQAFGASIKYLSADRNTVIGSATSASGVFVSQDAPFDTTFSVSGGAPFETVSAIGGLVVGKVTLVVLRYQGQIVNP